jgi:hypothetical protein
VRLSLPGRPLEGGHAERGGSRWRAVRRAWGLALFVVVFLALPLRAQEMLRPEEQIPLLLKILTYDRQFEAKAGKELVIGIVYSPAANTSAVAIHDVLDRFAGKTVKKLPLSAYLVEYSSTADLLNALKARPISVFYICPDTQHLPDILKVSQSRQITTTTGVPDYVKKGVAVGIGVVQDRPQIFINLPSTKAEGSEFDASLLTIATVYK